MTWLKENWFKLATLGVIALIVGGYFYWYEYKPTKIKERCSAEARLDSRAISQPNDEVRQGFINDYYNDCLMRFGLK